MRHVFFFVCISTWFMWRRFCGLRFTFRRRHVNHIEMQWNEKPEYSIIIGWISHAPCFRTLLYFDKIYMAAWNLCYFGVVDEFIWDSRKNGLILNSGASGTGGVSGWLWRFSWLRKSLVPAPESWNPGIITERSEIPMFLFFSSRLAGFIPFYVNTKTNRD